METERQRQGEKRGTEIERDRGTEIGTTETEGRRQGGT